MTMPPPGPSPEAPPAAPEPAPAPPPAVRLPRSLASFRHRNYRLYFAGQTLSLVGTFVQVTAMSWLAYHWTDLSQWTGAVQAASILPGFFLGPLGGALSERWPKRSLLYVTQTGMLVQALALAGLVLTGVRSPWPFLVAAAVNGLLNAVDVPARLAFLMEMVGREDLPNAIALNSLGFNVARIVGPVLGAGLLAGAERTLGPGGPSVCFFVNSLSFVAVLAALALMRLPGGPAPVPPHAADRSVRAAFAYVASRPRIALLLCLAGVLSVFGWSVMALLPAVAKVELHAGAQGYSWLLGSLGVGAMTSAFLVAHYGSVARRPGFIAAGVCLTVLGLVGLAGADTLAWAMSACVVLGAGLIMFFANSQSLVQLGAGDHNRGRVMGIWSMVISGGMPLGNLLAGAAADRTGNVPLVLCVLGLGCGSVALLVLLLFARRVWEKD
jgi:MFS family permease